MSSAKRFVYALLILMIPGLCGAQNLVTNPGFESYSICPTSISQINGYVSNWTSANGASPDYGNCGYYGNSAIRYSPATGNGALGSWGGASHPSCTGSAYAEVFKVALTSATVPGQTYNVSFQARVDGVGTATSAPNNCTDLGVYLYNSASPPNMSGWCCLPVTPQWSFASGSVSQGTYNLFSGSFTAAGTYDMIIVGPFCNGNTSSGACGTYTSVRNYFNFDDIVLEPASVLSGDHLSLEVQAAPRWIDLGWNAPSDAYPVSFTLEEGNALGSFDAIETISAVPGQSQYRQRLPDLRMGPLWFRISVQMEDGSIRFSEPVSIERSTSGMEGGSLSLLHSAESAEMQVLLPYPGHFNITWTDMNGRTVMEQERECVGSTESFDVSLLPRGVYVVKMKDLNGSGSWAGKWVR